MDNKIIPFPSETPAMNDELEKNLKEIADQAMSDKWFDEQAAEANKCISVVEEIFKQIDPEAGYVYEGSITKDGYLYIKYFNPHMSMEDSHCCLRIPVDNLHVDNVEYAIDMPQELKYPTEEKKSTEPFQIDPEDENPLNEASEKQLLQLVNQLRNMVSIMEQQWSSSRDEFKLTIAHMKQLGDFNEEHRDPPPEGVTVDDESYDKFNGINKITEEKVEEIFGVDHPIIGVQFSQTLDRLRDSFHDFFHWQVALQQYSQVHDGYIELIELQEDRNLAILQSKAEAHEDPEEREKALKSIEEYYANKYLDFLKEPLDEKVVISIIKAFSDERKVSYWIEKTRRKLKQLKASGKFILEISQFEKRFLDPKYHDQNNILLLYFLSLTMGCDPYNPGNKARIRVICIIFGLDRFIRNKWNPEVRERILNNVIAFQEQFIGKFTELEPTGSSDVE